MGIMGIIGVASKFLGSIGDVVKTKHIARGVILSSWAGMALAMFIFSAYLYTTYLVWYNIEAPAGVDFMLVVRYELLALFTGIMGISTPAMIKGIKIKGKDLKKTLDINTAKKAAILASNPKPSVNHNEGLVILRDYKKKSTQSVVLYNGAATGVNILELPTEYDGVPNVQGKCCILEGTYDIQYLAHTAKGKDFGGIGCIWIKDVVGRSGILIHPGNWLRQIQGCLLPCKSITSGPKANQSRPAFAELNKLITRKDVKQITITS